MGETITDSFGLADLKQELNLDEGVKRMPYVDTKGKVTIGTGRNLSDVGISWEENDLMLTNDIATACTGLDTHQSWWRSLPAQQARVMVNLAFNMGVAELDKFVVFLAAMRAQKWDAAADALRDSAWYGEVGQRGPRICARLGGWQV